MSAKEWSIDWDGGGTSPRGEERTGIEVPWVDWALGDDDEVDHLWECEGSGEFGNMIGGQWGIDAGGEFFFGVKPGTIGGFDGWIDGSFHGSIGGVGTI